jgi:hypothetical protein
MKAWKLEGLPGTLSTSTIETAIRDLDRSVPVFDDRTVEQVMSEASSRRRIAMIVRRSVRSPRS